MNRPLLLLAAAAGAAVLSAQNTGIPECKDTIKTASGLEYCVLQKGSDQPGPAATDLVVVHYTGWLTNGTKFDSSRDRGEPARFGLNQVIAGWTEGLQLMSPGARFKLTIPPELGYGSQDKGEIPPNSVLVFDVELLEIVRMPKFRPANQEATKTTGSGLKYEIVKVGTGAMPGKDDAVEMRYALFSTGGELQFCSEQQDHKLSGTKDMLPFPFLQELCSILKVGDVVRCEVPAALGSGDKPIGRLQPGSVTVWEIELTKVMPVPAFQASDPAKLQKTESGLQYEIVKQGEGRRPKATDTVLAHYTGWLLDGSVFDSSHLRGAPTEFALNRVIPGWTEGLQLMQEGGVFQFVIPAELAYGSRGAPPKIGPNATLVFRVELIQVK